MYSNSTYQIKLTVYKQNSKSTNKYTNELKKKKTLIVDLTIVTKLKLLIVFLLFSLFLIKLIDSQTNMVSSKGLDGFLNVANKE